MRSGETRLLPFLCPDRHKLAVAENLKHTGQKSKMDNELNDVKKQMEEKLERGSASINRIKHTSQICYAKDMWNVAHQCLKVIVTKYRCDSSVMTLKFVTLIYDFEV